MSRLGASLLAAGVVVSLAAGCLPAAPAERVRPASGVAALEVANPGVVEIADLASFDRIVAVSDVHGMYGPVVRLLAAGKLIDSAQHWKGGRTLLVVVGDSIDKGPQSVEVLDLWMALSAQAPAAGGRVVHVLGNHEAEFLASGGTGDKAAELLAELAARKIPVSDLTEPVHPRGAFLAAEPLAARVGRWLFCHAGAYPAMPWGAFKAAAASVLSRRAYGDALLASDSSILEAKDWWKDPAARTELETRLAANGLFGVVQGHQPKAYGVVGRIGAIDGGHLIKIDNGMAPEAGANAGSLLVFPTPAELAVDAYPHALVVNADGTSAPLQPN